MKLQHSLTYLLFLFYSIKTKPEIPRTYFCQGLRNFLYLQFYYIWVCMYGCGLPYVSMRVKASNQLQVSFLRRELSCFFFFQRGGLPVGLELADLAGWLVEPWDLHGSIS